MNQVCAVENPEDAATSFSVDTKRNWPLAADKNLNSNENLLGANRRTSDASTATPSLTALSVEFVAVPREAKRLRDVIPADLEAALQMLDGYKGCMVLVSDQEARLVTVITLWSGSEGLKQCRENAKWVKHLLTPYVDRWLRTQTQITSLKGMQEFTVDARR
ncbi:MAG: hypothetical protein WCE52_14925 [Candidatus Acidiferrum sp.]